ncbi:n-acetylglutamate synthase [Avibacterium endocarditidis]|uniref:N-acetylglutamate synthase n=1 Tax=Avibacterium endocarditidis TaxID=380674 RepID=A0ABX4ZU42_9PAST|nr:n-acetylglutamate synthase [Avibacterium endocarditidis]POY43017.1 n-acetylglutamate synthase [Avibacterium endocarditidis]
MTYNLNQKIFAAVVNSESGEVSNQTRFHYFQQGTMIWAEYASGEIKKGFLIGKFISDDEISFTYQHLNQQLENRLGKCVSKISSLPSGKLRLNEQWQWLDGEQETGESVIEEI